MNNCERIEVPNARRNDSHSRSRRVHAFGRPREVESAPTGLHTVLCVTPHYEAPLLSLKLASLCASVGWRSLLLDLNPVSHNPANYFTVNDLLNGKKASNLEKIKNRLSVIRNLPGSGEKLAMDPLREAIGFRDGIRHMSSTHDVCFIEARSVSKARLHSLLAVADSVATVSDDSARSVGDLLELNESVRICATLNPRLTGVTVANVSTGIDENGLLAMYSALLAEQAA